jgi:hypothetical protein
MNIDKIKNKAKFVLDDFHYTKFVNFLNEGEVNSARIMIDELCDDLERRLNYCEDSEFEEILKEIELFNQIESEIFNLYVEEDEGEQIKQIIR